MGAHVEPAAGGSPLLDGIRVLEIADETGEYCGRLLAGLGADVVKVEPPGGEITRTYGPFQGDQPDPDKSLYFWHYNLGKRSMVLDLEADHDVSRLTRLISEADVLLTSRPDTYMASFGLDRETLLSQHPRLVYARITPFGEHGPWAGYKGSDLVHLALGGVASNCGYDPDPYGTYDTPPIAPQMWLSYAITGEMTAFAINAALYYRARSGRGQYVSASVHNAVSKNSENDVPNYLYSGMTHYRQTCRHSGPQLSPPTICASKNGRWHLPYRTYMTSAMKNDVPNTAKLLAQYSMQADLDDPRYEDPEFVRRPEVTAHVGHVVADFFSRILDGETVWQEAQNVGLPWSSLRRPEENLREPHWEKRGTFAEILDRSSGERYVDVVQKWVSTAPWRSVDAFPTLGDGHDGWLPREAGGAAPELPASATVPDTSLPHGRPFALEGVRVVDLSWLLASGGAGRYLAALGAEVIKVEHHSRPDHIRGSWVGRVPELEKQDPSRAMNRSGAFNDINAGKLSLSLNLKEAEGRDILLRLVRSSHAVISGFSPGTMERLGLGYDVLKAENPSIVFVEQSAMGDGGTYGAFRGYGPTAQALAGLSEMSGLEEPFPPAGIGYSFLDWFGAYNMANAIMAGILHSASTGEGCKIDASQVEAGIYLAGTSLLDFSVNRRRWTRYGNRSPYKAGSPHGIYRVSGDDRWVAVSCFSDEEWGALVSTLGAGHLAEDDRFVSLAERLNHQEELDEAIEEHTSKWDGYELMNALQSCGVPAGVCQSAQDRCERDPQLAYDGWLVPLPQTDMGVWPVKEVPFAMSATPAAIGGPRRRHGPSYGEDSDYVLQRILGLDDDELRNLKDSGVVAE